MVVLSNIFIILFCREQSRCLCDTKPFDSCTAMEKQYLPPVNLIEFISVKDAATNYGTLKRVVWYFEECGVVL